MLAQLSPTANACLPSGATAGATTLPTEVYDLVAGAELFVQQAQHNSAALVPPQGIIHCQHDQPQAECSHAEPGCPCPVSDELKYRMTRFSLDYVDISLEEASSSICFQSLQFMFSSSALLCSLHHTFVFPNLPASLARNSAPSSPAPLLCYLPGGFTL
ncbi:hypothetical protein HPB51_013108 [Rhipicephalus microplus]|uniref:Uncharacterized protein n=1 Tax=Rhipicephalus microplus TaxID=6941 RepID=A0A9J6F2F7_RHIMP|nr:hypothetical protein HPB51_013108 [Rhipicephalus microplus]